jgi:AraC-like DNA-binding protein
MTPTYRIRDLIEFWAIEYSAQDDFVFITEVDINEQTFHFIPNYYAFGLVKEGLLELEIDNVFYQVKQNSLFIHRPNQLIGSVKISEGIKMFIVCFKKDFFDSLNENIFTVKNHSFLSDGIASYILLEKEDRDSLLQIYGHIFHLYKSLPKNNEKYIARSLTSALIYETDNILANYIDYSTAVRSESEKLTQNFKNLVYENCLKHRKVSFYASKLNVSPGYLYSIFKRTTNKSPSRFIQLQLLSEAKKELNTSGSSITDIASHLNFSDPYSFSKFFKKHVGCSPTEYRMRCNQNK